MEPIIAPSARKRGHDDADILHAYDNPILTEPIDDEGLTMIIGGDRAGNLLEIGMVVGELGPVIVHCMPARDKYLRRR